MPAKQTKQTKLTRGTHRAHRDRTGATSGALLDVPEPPADLDQRARSEWFALAQILIDMSILHASDLKALAILCRMLVQERELVDVLARDGLLIVGAGKYQKAHPAARMLESCRAQLAQLLDRFALTPRAREGLNVKPRRKDYGPLTKYLS